MGKFHSKHDVHSCYTNTMTENKNNNTVIMLVYQERIIIMPIFYLYTLLYLIIIGRAAKIISLNPRGHHELKPEKILYCLLRVDSSEIDYSVNHLNAVWYTVLTYL